MNGAHALDRLKELTRPTGEEDLLDVAYPSPRFTVSPKHALAVAVLVIVGLLVWLAIRPDTSPADSGSEEPYPEWSAAGETTSAPESLVVSVVGEVASPGLVTVTPGARVADALEAAAPAPEADIISLNQAQLLVDGQQIHVPASGAAPLPAEGEAGAAPGTGLISLNSAEAAELMELDGIGEATAASIIAHREEIGSFTDIEQLLDVSGIGPAKFTAIKDEVGL